MITPFEYFIVKDFWFDQKACRLALQIFGSKTNFVSMYKEV